MLKQLIIMISIVLLSVPVYTQTPDTLWTRTYGSTSDDFGLGVQQTDDGGFIIIGKTDSNTAGMNDIYLIKTDADGDTLWTRKYGGEFGDAGHYVLQNDGGGYILVCKYGLTSSNCCLHLIKTDENGDTLWTRTHPDHPVYKHIEQCEDGGYIIAGTTGYDAAMIKTDSLGEIEWAQTYSGSERDYGTCAVQSSDGGYLLTGSVTQNYPSQTNVFLVKTDAEGDTIWMRSIGEEYVDTGASVIEDSNGDYVVTGMINGETGSDTYADVYLVKVDVHGETLWTNFFGGGYLDWGKSVVNSDDGGYVITGLSDYGWIIPYEGDLNLIKADRNGNEEWYLSFGGSEYDIGNCVRKTADGGYIVAGTTASYGAGSYDIWLLRFEGEQSDIAESDNDSLKEFELYPAYPNPFNPTTTVSFDLPVSGEIRLNVYDIQGRFVGAIHESPLQTWYPAGQHRVVWDAEGMSSGVYFISIHAEGINQIEKVILVK